MPCRTGLNDAAGMFADQLRSELPGQLKLVEAQTGLKFQVLTKTSNFSDPGQAIELWTAEIIRSTVPDCITLAMLKTPPVYRVVVGAKASKDQMLTVNHFAEAQAMFSNTARIVHPGAFDRAVFDTIRYLVNEHKKVRIQKQNDRMPGWRLEENITRPMLQVWGAGVGIGISLLVICLVLWVKQVTHNKAKDNAPIIP